MNLWQTLVHALTTGTVDREIKCAERDYERETLQEVLGCKSHHPANPMLALKLGVHRKPDNRLPPCLPHAWDGMDHWEAH